MIPVVYPLIKSKWNEEIRYSIRSFQKYFTDDWEPWIIGYKPDWYTGRHIPYYDAPGFPSEPSKMVIASCLYEEFIWCNDDMYLLKETNTEHLKRPLIIPGGMGKPFRRRMTKWRAALWRTYDDLKKKGYPAYNNALHIPKYYDSKKLQEVMTEFEFIPGAHLLQMVYFNLTLKGQKPTPYMNRIGFYEVGLDACCKDWVNARYLNHIDRALTPALMKNIISLFPEVSSYEK